MDVKHAKLIVAMTEYDRGDPKRIQHFMKVHDYAAAIGILEGLDPKTPSCMISVSTLANRNTVPATVSIRKERDRMRRGG